jgi:NADPH:quinone reductase
MKAIRIDGPGGPEVLKLVDVPDPVPAADEALVRIQAIGVNYIEIYQRTGLYPMSYPMTPGSEAAGTIVAIGDGTKSDLKAGDRVVWEGSPGAYAEMAKVPLTRLVRIPDEVTTDQAAAVMLQGMTAHYLVTDTFPLKPGDDCLIQAAAGGVGLLFCQMASRVGAHVIGTASTDEKAELARQAGADSVINYKTEDFAAEAKRLTQGRGVRVVYDSVGKATWEKSLDCLAPLGMLVLFGNSSGAVPPLDPLLLARKGSLYLTRPTLAHYVATRDALVQRASTVLNAVAAGALQVRIDRVFPLAEAGAAQALLESRQTSGKVLIKPSE